MAFQLEGAKEMATASPLDTGNFMIAIIAESGEGKTWLASSAASEEERLFHFDFDNRQQSLATHPKKQWITSKTYHDVDFPNRMPMAWQNFLGDLMQMEVAFEQKELPYKWFVYDSATFGSTACLNWLLYNTPSLRRELKFAGHNTFIPKSFDAYKAEVAEVTAAWSRIRCMGNLIVIFHIDEEKDKVNSTKEEAKYTGKKTVSPPRYADLLSLFNDQWRIKAISGTQYEVQTETSYDFIAKRTLLVDATETPDIRAMIEKHRQKVGA